MTLTETEGYQSGFIALAGSPNVGKSSLVNAFLAQPIVAISPKPQTTRKNQLGILSLPAAQLILVDTPGIHQPMHRLGETMNAAAEQALSDADIVMVLFDLSRPPNAEDQRVAKVCSCLPAEIPILGILNKIDLVPPEELNKRWNAYSALLPGVELIGVSATRGDQLDLLLDRLVHLLPEGPKYYEDELITDAYERDIAADLIRSACLTLLRDEVPHAIAVRIDEYKERGEQGAYVNATLFVERESQKGIVIGKAGKMLKQIGTIAREDIERMSGRKIYLDLKVKVQPRWRDDNQALKRFGY